MVGVAVTDGPSVCTGVGDREAVGEGAVGLVDVGVALGFGDSVDVAVGVGVSVGVAVRVGVGLIAGVGVGSIQVAAGRAQTRVAMCPARDCVMLPAGANCPVLAL
jgi:hypothetical protein